MATLSTSFQILAANPGQVSLHTPILNQVTQLPGVPVGGTALINATGLPQNLSGWTLLIGGQPASFSAAGGQIAAVVPTGLLTGAEIVQLISPAGGNIPPVYMQVDPPPPVIAAASVSGATGTASSFS